VYYTLTQPAQEVTLEFLDAQGKRIKLYSSKLDSAAYADSVQQAKEQSAKRDSLEKAGVPADSIKKLLRSESGNERRGRRGGGREPRVANKVGLNDFVWDLRYPDAASFRGLIMWAGGTNGPVAPPGTYTVRMAVNGKPVGTQRFTLKKDPRASATLADFKAQFALQIRIRDRLTEANNAVRTIRNVKYQLTQREGDMHGADSARFASAADAFAKRLSVVEDSIYQTKNRSGQDPLNFPIRLNNRIAALMGVVSDANGRPTAQSYAVFKVLSAKLDTQLGLLKAAMADGLPNVNALLTQAKLPKIVPSTAELGPEKGEVAEEDLAAEEMEQRHW
jgi:hypothetical protein